jgi:hypothetical protein
VIKVNKESFTLGGILFVIGLISGNLQAAVLTMGMGLVFMAVGLGKDACEELYEFFRSIFETLLEPFNRN